MISFVRLLRVSISVSLLLSIGSVACQPGTCYTGDSGTLLGLVVLHALLLLATFVDSKVMHILVLTIVVFYSSRLAVLQIDPSYYTYPTSIPSLSEMGRVVNILLAFVVAMVLGCYLGNVVGRGYQGRLDIIPFSDTIREEKYYRVVVWVFIVSKVVLLYLFVTSGVGLPIDRQFFSPVLLRIAKGARFFSYFGFVPVCWLILKRPQGSERTITILAIVLLILANVSTLSKVSLVYSVFPYVSPTGRSDSCR